MRLVLRLGWRYFRARSRDRFIGFMALVSMLGIVLGVAALTLVMSVMNGFDAELTRRILGVVPHVLVESPTNAVAGGDAGFEARLLALPGVRAAAPLVQLQGLLRSSARIQVVGVFGVDPVREASVSILPGAMVQGRFEALRPGGLILGAPLARYLGVGLGDALTLVVPQLGAAGGGTALQPVFRRIEVQGLFEVGAEPDYAIAVLHIDDLLGDFPGALRERLTLVDAFRVEEIVAALEALPELGRSPVETWAATHGSLFATVRLEKNLMFTMVLLIVAVAVFAIVSSQVLLVDEKRSEIAILRVLGQSRRRVAGVFFVHGMLAGCIGIAVGLTAGVMLSFGITRIVQLFETALGIQVLAGTYFQRVPSVVQAGDLLWIAGATGLLCAAASLYPAWRVAMRVPWDALRYG